MAVIIMMIIATGIHLAKCCKSKVEETILNVQNNSGMKEDISDIMESHRSANMIMIILILGGTIIALSCCYACTKHSMRTLRRSLAGEGVVHYGNNPSRETTFSIPK